MGITILQKGNVRYEFRQSEEQTTVTPWGRIGEYKKVYQIAVHNHMGLGSAYSIERTTKEKGNELYKKLLAEGFKKFRNIHEVSWYATLENNTPYEEKWEIEGDYFIPACSRNITYTEENPVWKIS